MELYGTGNEIWQIDESLRNIAANLIDRFNDDLGHIDLDKVIFVRVSGVKLKKERNWYGKCWRISAPIGIIPRYTVSRLGHANLLDLSDFGSYENVLDVSYIIGLSTDALSIVGGDTKRLEEITLHHELMHISPDMTKLVPHPIQDFSTILETYGLHWSLGVFEDEVQGKKFLNTFIKNLSKGVESDIETSD
jgi:hypothetical protein